ncbi:2,3-diphosphoglycerate-dependent phosphoglycerate mutase [bacterium]|nr:MAG: 2,3-diphosphoglycerate-dependent phosphoglycerate mutase [bacterium]
MPKLILVRHGQSLWNNQDRFTGWVDVPLTEEGRRQAQQAGELLKAHSFDVAYTSDLQRAQVTLDLILEHSGRQNTPVIRNRALNERMYGDLEGLNKARTVEKYGPELVKIWRRSYDIPPPNGESLKDTAARTIPFFERCILGDIADGRDVLVVAHGNSNRSMVMAIEKLTPEQILEVNLDTGVPRVYEIDEAGAFSAGLDLRAPALP